MEVEDGEERQPADQGHDDDQGGDPRGSGFLPVSEETRVRDPVPDVVDDVARGGADAGGAAHRVPHAAAVDGGGTTRSARGGPRNVERIRVYRRRARLCRGLHLRDGMAPGTGGQLELLLRLAGELDMQGGKFGEGRVILKSRFQQRRRNFHLVFDLFRKTLRRTRSRKHERRPVGLLREQPGRLNLLRVLPLRNVVDYHEIVRVRLAGAALIGTDAPGSCSLRVSAGRRANPVINETDQHERDHEY